MSANLLDAKQTLDAVEGSSIVYFTAGLPPDTQRWEAQFPTMLKNALDACRAAGASFTYFDNTYMYPQDARLQTEDTSFAPVGRKGKVRAAMTSMVLEEPGICHAATTGRPTRRSSRWPARSSNANPAIR